jgi:hypothetical protein
MKALSVFTIIISLGLFFLVNSLRVGESIWFEPEIQFALCIALTGYLLVFSIVANIKRSSRALASVGMLLSLLSIGILAHLLLNVGGMNGVSMPEMRFYIAMAVPVYFAIFSIVTFVKPPSKK